MGKVTIIKSLNKKNLLNVKLNFPELMVEGAEQSIKDEYNAILEKEEELQEARELVRKLEAERNKLKENFESKSSLFTLEFETIEKKHTTYDVGMSLKGTGNDLIGFK